MSKKRNKISIPKRIGGVKVPKPMRRGVKAFLASQNGRAIATEALLAVGAAVAASQGKSASSGRKAGVAGAAASSGAAFTYAIGEATRTFTDALRRGKDRADAEAAWPPVEEAEETPRPPTRGPGSGASAH